MDFGGIDVEGFGCICAGGRGNGVVVMDELDEVG